MKREKFLKTAAIGSTAVLVGYPLFKAESAPNLMKDPYNQNRIEWSNFENPSPYVDSNLWIRNGGIDVVTEVYTNSGTIDPVYGTNIEVIQMGIAGYQWQQFGSRGTLRVTLIELTDGPPPYKEHLLYDNLTFQWVEGIMDYYKIDLSDYQQHDGIYTWKVECYTSF